MNMVPDNITNAADKPEPEAPKKKSWGAKAVLAFAFATVGGKIATLGTVADVSKLMSGEKVSFGEKLKGLTDGSFMKLITDDIQKNLGEASAQSNWAMAKAVSKTFKYSIAATVAFVGGGAVLGWVRGDRVDSAKDIFVHPIKSTKLILGIGEEAKKPEQTADKADDKTTASWVDRTSQRPPAEVTR